MNTLREKADFLYGQEFSVDALLFAYQNGFFPMGDETSGIVWHCPDPRAIFPLDEIKISRSTRQMMRKSGFTYFLNRSFEEVILGCSDRQDSWITPEIMETYRMLHAMGYAHSVETYVGDELVGGLYGVSLGGAFFGESMFSLVPGASKAAFAVSVARLKERGFLLLDSQYINHHTASLGAIEIARDEYFERLGHAIEQPIRFSGDSPEEITVEDV